MAVCILGDPEDLAFAYIGWIARELGFTVLQVAEGGLGESWDYELQEEEGTGWLRVGDVRTTWDAIQGVFVRLNPEPPLPAALVLDEPYRMRFVQERREGLHQLLESVSCTVVNRPSAGRSNASKPYQMSQLEIAGFDVPRWVVSNQSEEVRAFCGECRDQAIYKATSGLRSRVRMVDELFIERMSAGSTPTVVQEYVAGVDVRVHTVGHAAFACEVSGAGVDYRFESEGATYSATEIPDAIAAQCCSFAEREGVVLAGFDFRRTPDGRWRCLEMNPVPSFLPYEFSAGLPIGRAVVAALTRKEGP